MPQITNPRVIDSHAAVGKVAPQQLPTPRSWPLRTPRVRTPRRQTQRILAAQSIRDSESQAPRSGIRLPHAVGDRLISHVSQTPLHSVIDADNSVSQLQQPLGPNQQLAYASR